MEERMRPRQVRRCGAIGREDGSVLWRTWAPNARRVDLVLIDGEARRTVPMRPEGDGHFRREEAAAPLDQRYAYRLDEGPERPDPCSLWQPDGVHAASAVVFPERFAWSDQAWKGAPRRDLVFYELHVGTFTPEGTFESVVPRLRALRELGATAIQLMPVAQFPGARDWGYDGVLPYAAQNSYGGPHGLQRLIDACHAEGLALYLDVVYNHFGPEGNYLAEFGPYFTERYRTPWGSAVNFDDRGSDAVRDYVLDNARMWLDEFHCDGLRLDAVHAIFDSGATHILQAIQEVAEEVERRRGWPALIVAESDLNDPRVLYPRARGGFGLAAQWADDFHHAAHSLLSGERAGYYTDFGRPDQLARAFECPFVYSGEHSSFRGRKHGAPPEGLSGDRFVVCIQNHDQVGNRALGDRLGALLEPAQRRLAAGLLLLSPYLPLLFMGQELGERNPFPFFCSFDDPGLIEAVRAGRRKEFSAFGWQGDLPDPQSEDVFASARPRWSWAEGTPAAGLRRLYHDLLAARREWPALRDFDHRTARLAPDEKLGPVLELVRGPEGRRDVARAFFNLSASPSPLPDGAPEGLPVLLSSEATVYGGGRGGDGPFTELAPFEFLVFGPPSWKSFLNADGALEGRQAAEDASSPQGGRGPAPPVR